METETAAQRGRPFWDACEWLISVVILSYLPSIGKALLSLIFIISTEEPDAQNAIISLNNCCNFCLFITSSALLDLKYFKNRDKIPNKAKHIMIGMYIFSAFIVALKKMGIKEVARNPLLFIIPLAIVSIIATLMTKYYMFLSEKQSSNIE